jgi:hypothetical protein
VQSRLNQYSQAATSKLVLLLQWENSSATPRNASGNGQVVYLIASLAQSLCPSLSSMPPLSFSLAPSLLSRGLSVVRHMATTSRPLVPLKRALRQQVKKFVAAIPDVQKHCEGTANADT